MLFDETVCEWKAHRIVLQQQIEDGSDLVDHWVVHKHHWCKKDFDHTTHHAWEHSFNVIRNCIGRRCRRFICSVTWSRGPRPATKRTVAERTRFRDAREEAGSSAFTMIFQLFRVFAEPCLDNSLLDKTSNNRSNTRRWHLIGHWNKKKQAFVAQSPTNYTYDDCCIKSI